VFDEETSTYKTRSTIRYCYARGYWAHFEPTDREEHSLACAYKSREMQYTRKLRQCGDRRQRTGRGKAVPVSSRN